MHKARSCFQSRRWQFSNLQKNILLLLSVASLCCLLSIHSKGDDGVLTARDNELAADEAHFDEPVCRFLPENPATYETSLTRAVVSYFSVAQVKVYIDQLRWCMRSLLEMMKTEPETWRTDIVLYVENVSLPELLELGCTTTPRMNPIEPFKCVLVRYVRVTNRRLNANSSDYDRDIQEQLREYPYGESLIPLAENPSAYAAYDVVIRSDLDVFFTSAFSRWIPPGCGFVSGNGGYSAPYNMEKLAHIANYSRIFFNASVWNIGSTWIGSSNLIAKIAKRSVYWMIEISKNNFSPKMRTIAWWGQIQLWPEWHYGVLSMYGSHLAINEVLLSRREGIYRKMDLDHPTTSTANCTQNGPIHLHTYQSAGYFSKYVFNERKYKGSHALPTFLNSTRCCDYAGYIAADSIALATRELVKRLKNAKEIK